MPLDKLNNLPLVTVVMSTYNGEEYLPVQIDSILAQDYPRISLLVRDDGSSDETEAILRQYASKHPNIQIIDGDNIGVVPSFFECLTHIGPGTSYVAFSDQDDLWHSDKISRAVHALKAEDQDVPLLYFSERNYCDENLEHPMPSHLNQRGVSFELSLFDNVCPGNTIVINRAMLELLQLSNPQDVYYHDWWIELLASCFGETLYDEEPTLEYRRLNDSVSPSGKRGIALLSYRVHEYLSSGRFGKIVDQNRSFLETYGSRMSEKNRNLMQKLCSGDRLGKALHAGRLRQSLSNELMLRGCFLMGKL